MHRVTVVTDHENADGFRLAGVEVHAVPSAEEARAKLAWLLDEDTTGIIVMNESYLDAIDERMRKKIDSLYRPIIVFLPLEHALGFEQEHGAYLSRLIRKAVGFDITLRRGA